MPIARQSLKRLLFEDTAVLRAEIIEKRRAEYEIAAIDTPIHDLRLLVKPDDLVVTQGQLAEPRGGLTPVIVPIFPCD